MQYTSIKKGRLADDVSDQVKEAIFQGEYHPGEKIPSEHELVDLFGVSRVIIREAIRNLEQAGLVEIRRGPKGGAFILPLTHKAVSLVVKDLFRLSKGTVKEIMEVRLELEPIVARLAAYRANKDDLNRYSSLFAKMLGSIYDNLKESDPVFLKGFICQPFYFGEEPDLSEIGELNPDNLQNLVYDDNFQGKLRTVRILRYYNKNIVLMIKPDRLRYWIKSTAIRDADEILHDLYNQGF